MKYKVKISVFILVTLFSMVLSIWGPEALARYQDKGLLNEIHVEEVEAAGEGYSYKLNVNEK